MSRTTGLALLVAYLLGLASAGLPALHPVVASQPEAVATTGRGVQALLALVLGLGAAVAMVGNAAAPFLARPGRSVSMVPFLGGAAGAAALLLSPWPAAHRWAWVPLLLDPGSALLVVASVVAVGRAALRRRGGGA